MQPELVFCPQCAVIHPNGRHLADPTKPAAGLEPERQIIVPQAAKPRRTRAVRQSPPKPEATSQSNFDKTAFQRDYMRDRRAADKAGLFHLTVKQYRAQREQQGVNV